MAEIAVALLFSLDDEPLYDPRPRGCLKSLKKNQKIKVAKMDIPHAYTPFKIREAFGIKENICV